MTREGEVRNESSIRRVARRTSVAERLAALAGLAAAVGSVAGFGPGLYRDPQVVIGQSHGYDLANLVVVAVLWSGLVASARGSISGRLVAAGALGCLLYSYVTYAFYLVLNPVTVLYIATLGFGGWAFALGLLPGREDADAAVGDRLHRRATGGFLVVLAVLFAVTWLGQIAGSLTSGELPVALRDAGWPMNPVWVEDLGFVLPLMALAGGRVLGRRAGGVRLAAPLLVFVALLGLSIVAMVVGAAIDGQPFEPVVSGMFAAVALIGAALSWITLGPVARREQIHQSGPTQRAAA